MHQYSKRIKYYLTLYTSPTGKKAQVPGHHSNHSQKMPNHIFLCLELLLPVVDMLVNEEDRPLLDRCTAKLGQVRDCRK